MESPNVGSMYEPDAKMDFGPIVSKLKAPDAPLFFPDDLRAEIPIVLARRESISALVEGLALGKGCSYQKRFKSRTP